MVMTSSSDKWVDKNVPQLERRDYQVEVWDKLWAYRSNGGKRALIHLATGLGKTSVAAVDVLHYLIEEQPKRKVLFVSHMRDISKQAKATFLHVNPNFTTATIIQGQVRDVDVTFATFQGLHRHLDKIPPASYSYIIWDEAHHIEARTFKEVREHFTPKFELALTATPERADGLDILEYFGKPLYVKSLESGIADGWLSPVDYHIVFDAAVKEAMSQKFGLTTLKEIRSLFSHRVRNEQIAKEVLQRRHDIGLDKAKTIVFCQNSGSADAMASLLGGEAYHSWVKPDERVKILNRFRNSQLQVICTVDMFNEGIDIPDARLVVFLRSTSSSTIFEQQLGRGLRRAPGKNEVTVLDFVANVERINYVRDLGHTISKLRDSNQQYSGFNTSRAAQKATTYTSKYFGISHFKFDDKAVELLDSYKKLIDRQHLSTAEVVAKYNELGQVSKVAEYFDVSWGAIGKHLKRAGIIYRKPRLAAVSHISDEEIKKAYVEDGYNLKITAKRYNTSSWTIKHRLLEAGETIRNQTAKKYASPELIAAYERLNNVRAAAKELGIPPYLALKRLKNSGVDTSNKRIKGGLPPELMEQIYTDTNGDIVKMFHMLRGRTSNVGWTKIYRCLDRYGYLERKGPITSAQAAAAYFKYGNSTEAGKHLGCSSTYICRLAKNAQYIHKYKQSEKHNSRKKEGEKIL